MPSRSCAPERTLPILPACAVVLGAAGAYAGNPHPACADGLDNDGDGFVDFPDDPDCASLDRSSEGDGSLPPVVPVGPLAPLVLVVAFLWVGARRAR